MKTLPAIALTILLTTVAYSEPTSENTPKLAEILERRPELDKNKDGILTLTEVRESRKPQENRNRTRPAKRAPTQANVSYGAHPSMQLDFWKADSEQPTPLFVFIHGGGFRGGDKGSINSALLEGFLKNGVSVASINYRLSGIAPYPAQMHDSARAVQFLRSKSKDWNIDATKLAAGGGSAGSGISQWLAFHDDLKNPDSKDPIERQSTRLSSAVALNMQSTYDPRIIIDIIPGNAFDDSALKPFYNLPADWNWKTSEIDTDLDALIKDASPINHLTADDPPVYIFHTERTRSPGNIHHPNFGNYLETAMTKAGIESVRRTDADYESSAAMYDDLIQFVLRHFKMEVPPKKQ